MVDFRQEVSDDVARMGKSFGSFIEDVGRGIAETQKRLDINSAQITKDLAATEIEVPAVVEQVLDDDGTPSSAGNAVNVTRQKMSLIQFIVPTFYQWRHVQLNLNFDVEEIGTIEDFKIKRRSRIGILGPMRFGFAATGATGTMSASDTDRADGSVDARLEPRPDITPPAPFLFRTGPTINFVPGGDIVDGSGHTAGAHLAVHVYKKDGLANDNQPIKVSVSQGRYAAPNGLTTDNNGVVELEVYKADPASTQPQTVTVSVALGIVHGRMDVTI